MRFAPSITIIRELIRQGAQVAAYDPVAMDRSREIMPDIKYATDPYGVASDADAVVLVTEWEQFRDLDFDKIKRLMRQPVLLDGRNFYDPEKVRRHGFIYSGIGR
jgi:UDPglucose 6-dehydrogenase